MLAQWKAIQDKKCPGCGRPIEQHLNNERLQRAETAEDYTAWTVDCPAQQALAEGQQMWKKENQRSLKAHYDGNGPDPSMGVFWLTQGPGESMIADKHGGGD